MDPMSFDPSVLHTTGIGLGMNNVPAQTPASVSYPSLREHSLEGNLNTNLDTPVDFAFPFGSLDEPPHRLDSTDTTQQRDIGFGRYGQGGSRQPTKRTRNIESEVHELRQWIHFLVAAKTRLQPEIDLIRAQVIQVQSQSYSLSERHGDLQRRFEGVRTAQETTSSQLLEYGTQLAALRSICESLHQQLKANHAAPDRHTDNSGGASFPLEAGTIMDRAVQALSDKQLEMSRKVDEHETDIAEIFEKLTKFSGHVTGGLGQISQYIKNPSSGAPDFPDIDELLHWNDEDGEFEL